MKILLLNHAHICKTPQQVSNGVMGNFFQKNIPTEVFKIQLNIPILCPKYNLRPKYNLFFFRREKNILRMKKFRSFLHDHLLQYVLDTFLIKKSAKKFFLSHHINILKFFFVFNGFFCRSAATRSGNFCQFELHILIGNILLYSYKNF
jgi:hypothetical protein